MKRVAVSVGSREWSLAELAVPLPLEDLVGDGGDWEVELGFGKGRYLLRRAVEEPRRRFLGLEMASAYYRLVRRRAERRAVENLVLIRGEARYLLSAALPRTFAAAVHIYFPDPWPKARHQRRRLLDAESVDLVLGLLRPGGLLYFATDHLEYGTAVKELLESHPLAEVRERPAGWEDGPRTNYEAKFVRRALPILRLQVTWGLAEPAAPLHPAGRAGILAATCPRSGDGPPAA